MKNLYILVLLITSAFVSCTDVDDTSDVSSTTFYPIITLNGEPEVIITQGTPYVDEGAVSTENGEEIPTETNYSPGSYEGASGVDSSVPDNYLVSYSAVNQDGFAGSALRSVWVAPPTGDLTTSIEGLYTADVQRAPTFTPSPQYDDLTYVFIWKTGANTYEISHALGGYYDLGRGYGPGYAARGAVITANDIGSNDFSISQAVFPIWGNTVDIIEFQVDASTKSITFTGNGNFGNGAFKVQLTQVQL